MKKIILILIFLTTNFHLFSNSTIELDIELDIFPDCELDTSGYLFKINIIDKDVIVKSDTVLLGKCINNFFFINLKYKLIFDKVEDVNVLIISLSEKHPNVFMRLKDFHHVNNTFYQYQFIFSKDFCLSSYSKELRESLFNSVYKSKSIKLEEKLTYTSKGSEQMINNHFFIKIPQKVIYGTEFLDIEPETEDFKFRSKTEKVNYNNLPHLNDFDEYYKPLLEHDKMKFGFKIVWFDVNDRISLTSKVKFLVIHNDSVIFKDTISIQTYLATNTYVYTNELYFKDENLQFVFEPLNDFYLPIIFKYDPSKHTCYTRREYTFAHSSSLINIFPKIIDFEKYGKEFKKEVYKSIVKGYKEDVKFVEIPVSHYYFNLLDSKFDRSKNIYIKNKKK